MKAAAVASMWTKPPFHNSNNSIESYRHVRMSVGAADAINAPICVSSLFRPGSWGDSGLVIVFLLTPGVGFHLPLPALLLYPNLSILLSPSTSLSHSCFVFEICQQHPPHTHLQAAHVAPRRFFDKTFRSSSEQKPAARQQ